MQTPAEVLLQIAHPISGAATDYDPLLRLAGDAHIVLLGESSHGTHEFYRERAAITKRLIEELGFNAVAVEGDWPDAYRVNRFVRGESDDATAEAALGAFRRFPQWMWRNADVLDFAGWLREYNDALPADAQKAGFYGLDLYSLHASMEAVIRYLDRVDPEAAGRARQRYACFDRFGGTEEYAFATGTGMRPSCEREVIEQLVDFRRRAAAYATRNGSIPRDEWFYASENVRLVRNAEEYYRAMFDGAEKTWNLRDAHMTETLQSLQRHLGAAGRAAKIVVWAHNSHVGDARATEMSQRGEWNIGQLTRERYGEDSVRIGFTTYDGTVTAASNWDAPAERKRVRPALANSYEALFYEVDRPAFFLTLRDKAALEVLDEPRLERAIGVIYLPESERRSHYFYSRIAQQFDAVIHIDRTRAVEPLEKSAAWIRGEVPETYPTGI
ncbi:MAG TPA: erythromycin esterase family protein [Thermoanaerobaculia bacterium]